MKRISSFFIATFLFLALQHSSVRATFPDVSSDHPNYEAINYVQSEGIVQGHPNGEYKPDDPITRAAFTKIIIESLSLKLPFINLNCFPDVPVGKWFHPPVCAAMHWQLIQGYPNGMFKPGNTITFVEAAKIITKALESTTESDTGQWYEPFVKELSDKKAIPLSISTLTQEISRGEMAEIIYRLKSKNRSKSSQSFQNNQLTNRSISAPTPAPSTPQNSSSPTTSTNPTTPAPTTPPSTPTPDTSTPNENPDNTSTVTHTSIDTGRVRIAWLKLYNDARAARGLAPYSYDERLHESALKWSQISADRGEITHKRNPGDSYYDYNIIKQWFLDEGLDFKNINRVTFTENIGYGSFNCSQTECTDELISAITNTFNFYMAEANQSYKPHYNSIMNQYFTIIGLGIVIQDNRYYLTVHYGTEIL